MKPKVFARCAGILFILLTAAGSLLAAPPANDNFANRINLGNTFPTSATGTNVDATEQSGEPLPISGLSSVWWRWTASTAGPVEVNTAGSLDGTDPLDTVLAVYTGTGLTGLVQVAVNDESAAGYNSLVRFTAVAGTTYVIQVLGWEGAEGSVKLNLKAGPPLPLNDAFTSAVTLTTGVALTGTTEGATIQSSEAVPVGIDAADYFGSSWWAWTAPSAGWYRLTVEGAGYSEVASVWTGTAINTLTPVHSNTGGFTGGLSDAAELYFIAAAGTRYPIAIGNSYSNEGAPVALMVSSVAMPPVYNASLTVSSSEADITSASATVNAVFRMVSAQPMTDGYVYISTRHGFFKSIAFGDAQRTSGTSTDGTYTVPVLLPRYLEPGPYRISRIYVHGEGFYQETGELSATPFAAGALRTINVSNAGAVDTAGPILTGVGVTPTTVDVTAGSKTITVTVQISDALAGFVEGTLMLERTVAGGSQSLSQTVFGSAQRTAGTAQKGTYAVELAVPASAFGDYILSINSLQDAAGNFADSTDSTDPAFPGPFTGMVRVNRTAVHVLNSFTLSAAPVDAASGARRVTATFSISTSVGDFSHGDLVFNHTAGGGSFGTYIFPADRTDGNAAAGSYSIILQDLRTLTAGTYLASLNLYGTDGASSFYGAGGLPFPAGAATSLNTGAADTAAPVVSFLSASPNVMSAGSAASFTTQVRITDDIAGVKEVTVYLTGPAGLPSLGAATLISGSAVDGVWQVSKPLPAGLVVGQYALIFSVYDWTNRFTSLTTNPGIPSQSITITEATNGYDTWASTNSLSGTDALATSDPDRDGTGNLMEFAMGMNPQSSPADGAGATAAGLPAASLTGSGAARHLTLGFWVPADLLAGNSLMLTYLAQFSSNGTTWTDVPQTSFAIDDGTALNTTSGLRRFCTVTDPVTYSASQPRFGRMRATVSP
ncbi:MAG: hypothetical protein V4675_15640 [Verrucomicrobiota bacterium]